MIRNGKEVLLSFTEISKQYKVSMVTLWRHKKQGILPIRERQGRPYVLLSFVKKNYQKRTEDETK